MMEIASRAAAVRKAEGKSPFLYTVVLTKTDKATEKILRQTEKDVREGTKAFMTTTSTTTSNSATATDSTVNIIHKTDADEVAEAEAGGVGKEVEKEVVGRIPILKTSSVERVGRDDVWRLLQDVLTQKRGN
jgi:hypothetical protein